MHVAARPAPHITPGAAHEQTPAVHVPAAPQLFAVAQEVPQTRLSVIRSTHAPSHSVFGAEHLHTLAAQASPAGHTWPHFPQLSGSVVGFTQAPSQAIIGAVHISGAHAPPTHEHGGVVQLAPVHAWPHVPQLSKSVCVSTQVAAASAPQSTAGAMQPPSTGGVPASFVVVPPVPPAPPAPAAPPPLAVPPAA